MKAAVLSFPGSNCDQDLLWALSDIAGIPADLVPASATDLSGYDLVCVPGGFSYGDYLRSGAIANFAPVMAALKKHAANGGLVLGICNGFQILCEAGLLPGALQFNESLNFICESEPLTVVNTNTAFSGDYQPNETIHLPIAHGEGNYYADPKTLAAIEAKQQVVFRYAANPNGSLNDIAGLTNAAGNVLGMMPHPERAVETLLGGRDGLPMFTALKKQMEGAAYATRRA
jgi:phosphoribosylformylglycinamidine synthase